MDCNEVERMQLIEGYLDESLSPEQMEALEKHYLECENCFSTLQLQHAIRLEAKPTDRHVGRSPEPESLQGWIATSRRWLLPLAALIVLLVVPLSLLIDRDSGPGGSNLPARLIEIESIPAYVETTVRGGQAGTPWHLSVRGWKPTGEKTTGQPSQVWSRLRLPIRITCRLPFTWACPIFCRTTRRPRPSGF